ncbi:MAG: cupin domain-containing protein [Promethearchaeota archaeon]
MLGKKSVLRNMVKYQKDSIVSMTLIDKMVGTVTLFSFDAGQSLSEHTTPYDALVYLAEGEGSFIIGEEEHVLKEGDTIIMPADVPHAVNAIKKFKMMLIMIKSG